jgi:hypothetical protein
MHLFRVTPECSSLSKPNAHHSRIPVMTSPKLLLQETQDDNFKIQNDMNTHTHTESDWKVNNGEIRTLIQWAEKCSGNFLLSLHLFVSSGQRR